MYPYRPQSGFTLIEMIVVMVITGIIAGMVAIFLKAPVQQYVDSARRAELTDIAGTAFQRLLRDIRTSVPNSVIVSGTTPNFKIEFLPTKSGGRYRANPTGGGGGCGAAGDDLAFAPVADSCFEVIGQAVPATANADYLVVGSTQSTGLLPYDQTTTGVLRTLTTGTNGTVINFTATALPISAQLNSQRFQIVDGTQQAVTYSCETVGTNASGDGTGVLRRYWGYGFTHTVGTQSAILANNLSGCSIDYSIVNQRNGLVGITLQITQANETVSLYEEVHVNNAP